MKARGETSELTRTSWRLGVQTGLLLVGVLAVFGLVLLGLYVRAQHAAADQLLRDTTAHVDRADEAPPGVRVAVVTPYGRTVSPGMPPGFPDEHTIAVVRRDGRTRQFDVHRGEHDFTVRTQRTSGHVVQAVLDHGEAEEERERIVSSLLVAGGVGVLLAALVSVWLARRAVSPLAETVAMQRRFVADASHELRTPLTLLSTRVQLLARRARRGGVTPGDEDLAGVLADTRVLTDILDDLLVAADTRASAPREPVDVGRLAEDVVAAARAAADRAGVDLVLRVEGHPVVQGVPTALRRALTALVDNAVEHARSHVELRVDRHHRHVRVVVADDGPGIPSEVAPRLFERFTSLRDDAQPREGRRHYGIGLALVADVAAAHHGTVSAQNRDDGDTGAMLTLTLAAH
ncbi:MAG: sensor histidine kinase [Nocardioidaceae bacterium]